MHLKSLQLSGFKSFAKKTTLEFTKGITAIVGPNGSGKSNIADAVRWVMGEQSIKTLRGKKSEDVIFSGSDKKARLGLAEVSLELDNSDKKVPINYGELLVSRRVYRSGESDYIINGAKSRLIDVNLLLTKANFGHRTYSVIGQGMIDNFLVATPQERKEFFEEASGVKQYQIKKNQALSKLENVWQNLSTLNIKIQEMEPQLRLLTRQVKKLEKRKVVEKELQDLRKTYYSSYWQEMDGRYIKEKGEIDKYTGDKNKIEVVWENLEKQVKQVAYDGGLNKKIEALREEQQEIMENKMKLREELLQLKMSLAGEQKATLVNLKMISRAELEDVNKQVEQANLMHEKLIDLLNREKNIEVIKKEILIINKKIDKVLQLLKPYCKIQEKQMAQKTDKELTAEKKLKLIEENLDKYDKKITEIQLEIKKIAKEDEEGRRGLWQVQQEFQKEQQKLNEINSKINEVRVELARVETKRYDLRQEIEYELGGLGELSQEKQETLGEGQKITMVNRINRLKNQLEVIGGIDPEIEAEYETTKQRYDYLDNQTNDLTNTMETLKKLIADLDATIKKKMKESYDDINKYFQKYFKSLFSGGKAELVLLKEKELEKEETDEEGEIKKEGGAINFFQEKSKSMGYAGIEVQATPPGKRLKSINALSGGEKALTSIALICAIISSSPSPFVVLDEVDAALDESNSIRFAEILEGLAHKTQFVIITHNRATMEKAKLLYGVTMSDDGISKLVGLKLEEAKKHVNR